MRAAATGSARGGRGEAGAATVVAVTLGCVLVVVTLAATALGRLLVDHRRAAMAADLAALAGAGAVQRGADGCAAAQGNADVNEAQVLTCVVRGEEVRVSVRVGSFAVLGQVVSPRAWARAGPVAH